MVNSAPCSAETVGAANFGRHEGMEKSGFTEFEWFTALDERVRDDHIAMQGARRKKGEFWIVGGASLRYPGDENGPAEQVVNCRCIEVCIPESSE